MSSYQITIFYVFICAILNFVKTNVILWSEPDGSGLSKNYTHYYPNRYHCAQNPVTDFKVRSITTDSCVWFYPSKNCSGMFGNARLEIYQTTKTWPYKPDVRSWVACSPRFSAFVYIDPNIDKEPLKKFQDICKCVNIPDHLLYKDIYVNTLDKPFLAYEGKNCTGSYDSSTGGIFLKASLQPFNHSAGCPLLRGIVSSVTNFKRTKPRQVELERLNVTLRQNTTNVSLSDYGVQLTLKGEDTLSINLPELTWIKRLQTCHVKSGLTLQQKLWEGSWDNESMLEDAIVASHCNKGGLQADTIQNRPLQSNKPLHLTRSINVAALNHSAIVGSRGYVNGTFSYTIFVNVTGVRESDNSSYLVKSVEDSLPQSGLIFVSKLDNFTILAEVTGVIEVRYPVSTVYDYPKLS